MAVVVIAMVGAFFLGGVALAPQFCGHSSSESARIRERSFEELRATHELLSVLRGLQAKGDTPELREHLQMLLEIRIGERFFGDCPPCFSGTNALSLPGASEWLPLLSSLADFRARYGWRTDAPPVLDPFLDAARQQARQSSNVSGGPRAD